MKKKKNSIYLSLAEKISENMTESFWLCYDLPEEPRFSLRPRVLHLFEPLPSERIDDSMGWFTSSFCHHSRDTKTQMEGNEHRITALLFMHEISKDENS